MPETNPPEGPSGPQPSGKSKPWSNVWMLATFAVLVVFAASMFMVTQNGSGITGAAVSVVPANEVAKKTVAFITSDIMAGQSVATLINVTEKSGLYVVTFEVDDKVYSAFVSKDGKFIFPQSLDMTAAATAPPAAEVKTAAVPIVKFFVMSFCPYGQQAETGLKPVAEMLKGKATFEPHYVVYNNYCGYGVNPSTCTKAQWAQYCYDNQSYCSLHGINEMKEDLRQMAIYKLYPDKFWAYVDSVNTKAAIDTVEAVWKDSAKSVGIDTAKVEAYVAANGKAMAAAEYALDQQLGVQGSPTIFINGADYAGGRAPEDFKTAICNAFTAKPSECGQALSTTAGAASGSCNT